MRAPGCAGACTAVALAFAGCLPSADVKAPEVELPAGYQAAEEPGHLGQASGPSAGKLPWGEYFADPGLVELIGKALAANPDVHVALQRIEVARAGVREAAGAQLPQVALAAGAGLRKFGRYTMDGAGNASTEIRPGQIVPTHLPDFSVGLQSAWELDLWGKLGNRRKAAVARFLASVEGSHLVVTTLVADVAVAYFELLALDHVRDALDEGVARQSQALEIVRLQKQAGRANELAVQQFEAQLSSSQALAARAQERTQLTETRLNLLLGRLPQPLPRSKQALFEHVAGSVSAGVPSDLLRNRPDIRRAELEVRAARCDLRAARAAFLPSFDIFAGVGYQAFNPRFLFSTPESVAYSATLGLLAPLVNRAGIEAEFSAAKAHQLEALYNYQKAVLSAFAEVAGGLVTLERSREILAARRGQRDAVRGTVETADTLYRAGKATYFEVLMAQQGTLAAELELIEALKDQRLASVRLYRALGGGWQ